MYKRQRQSGAIREGKLAGNRPKKGGSVKHYFSCYNNDLAWLCCEAAAKVSLKRDFPDLREDTGNSVENRPLSSTEAQQSQGIAGEIPCTRNRDNLDANRECCLRQQGLTLPLSDFSTSLSSTDASVLAAA